MPNHPTAEGSPPPTTLRITLTVFLPFTFGYFLSYLYRNVNSVLFPYFEADIGITAGGLGLLTAAYFLSFAAFQLPLGMLLDRFGPRRVEACLLLFAAGGAVVFSLAESVGGLFVGRLLIGLGVSGCLMAAFKANVIWWPAERLPLINGLFMLSGGLGAMTGTAPVAAIVELLGWRQVFLLLAVLTLVTAGLLLLVVPEREPAESRKTARIRKTAKTRKTPEAWKTAGALGAPAARDATVTMGGPAVESSGAALRPSGAAVTSSGAAVASSGAMDMVRGVWSVWTSRPFWEIAPATVLIHGAFINYQGFWAGPWLRDIEALPDAAVANWVFATAVCLTAGYAFNALVVDWLRRRTVDPLGVTIRFMLAVMAAEAALVGLPAGFSPYLWCLFAFFGTGTITAYAVLTQMYPAKLSGRATTALNLMVFSAVFCLQSGVGWIVDRFAPAAGQVYAPAGHKAALALLLSVQLPAVVWLVRSRR